MAETDLRQKIDPLADSSGRKGRDQQSRRLKRGNHPFKDELSASGGFLRARRWRYTGFPAVPNGLSPLQ